MWICTLVVMWRSEMFIQLVSFPFISSVLLCGAGESIVVHYFYSASLMFFPLSLSLHSFFFHYFSPFSLLCVFHSLPTLSSSPSFFPIFHQCQGFWTSPRYQALMSVFTKALIHQDKERQREWGRRMDDKGKRENKREGGRCWSVPSKSFGL